MIGVNEYLDKEFLDERDIYLGSVVDNADPDEGYKLKIKIFPFFSGVDDADIPWANPLNSDVDHLKGLPKVGEYVWCIFKGTPITPFWSAKKLSATGGQYTINRTELNAKLASIGISSLDYGKYDLIRCGKTIIILNESGEGAIVSEDIAFPIAFVINSDGIKIVAGSNEINVEKAMVPLLSGKIEITSTGGVKINGSLAGGVTINDGLIPAPNLPACILSGALLCTSPLTAPKIP